MASHRVAEVRAVGAMGAVCGPGLFDRADLILQVPGGVPFHGRRWTEGRVEGAELPEEDLDALVQCGEAMRFGRPLELPGKSGAWFVRKGFGDKGALREELVSAEALLGEEINGDNRLWVVAEERVPGKRRDWADFSCTKARELLAQGRAREAATTAERAWLMTTEVTPGIVALWMFCLRRAGEGEEAEDIRIIEKNSRGEAFDARVADELAKLERTLTRQDNNRNSRSNIPSSRNVYQKQMAA